MACALDVQKEDSIMASFLIHIGALTALGVAVIAGPQAPPAVAAENAVSVAAPAEVGNAKTKGKGPGRGTENLSAPARPILGNLSIMPGEQCADDRRSRSKDKSVASCERRPRGHGRDGRSRPDRRPD
jgi:hypothetical protein